MHHQNPFVTYSIENGVLHLSCRAGVHISISDAHRIVADRLMVQGEREYPAVCVLEGVLQVDHPALEFFAREGTMLITALAFITNEKRHLYYLVGYFLKVGLPGIPSGVFEQLDQGLEFLNKHR